jgi:toxin FitB
MKFLLDTCTLNELRHRQGHPAVKATIALIPADDMFLSAIAVGEIARGIALLADGRKKRALNTWLTALERQFSDHILSVDAETAHLWGDIAARTQQAGLILPVIDGLVAATALRHGLYIITHNTTHFAATGAQIVDPWREPAQGNPKAM